MTTTMTKTPCPHCGKHFQRVKAHISKSGCGTPAQTPITFAYDDEGERAWHHPTEGWAGEDSGAFISAEFRTAIEAHLEFRGWRTPVYRCVDCPYTSQTFSEFFRSRCFECAETKERADYAREQETETKPCGGCGTKTDYCVCANECGTIECERCCDPNSHLCRTCATCEQEKEEEHECDEEDCETCGRGIYCSCMDDRCPHCNSRDHAAEEPVVLTLADRIWAWLSANATEWTGKTAREIATALDEDKHVVNQALYMNKTQFVQMTVAGQTAPLWRCVTPTAEPPTHEPWTPEQWKAWYAVFHSR